MSAAGWDRSELAARIALLATPGLRPHDVLELVRLHGSGGSAVAALQAQRHPGIRSLRTPLLRERVRRTLRVVTDLQIQVWAPDLPGYPARVAERLGGDAPPLLFARGDASLLNRTGIGVVGCRAASEYGLDMAERIGEVIGRAGACVVSGLARGIDAAAQRAALDARGGTIGVLGCGVDVHYPRENTTLQDRLSSEGLLLSEFLPGEPPMKHHFPYRNRIIAALSRAVVVVEAARRSGAVKTAEHALMQATDVYIVPNALDQPNMQGLLDLARNGALLFTGTRDLLETLGVLQLGSEVPPPPAATPPADALHAALWERLTLDGRHVDAVAAEAGVPATMALVALLELELDGRVRQLPGSRFARERLELRI